MSKGYVSPQAAAVGESFLLPRFPDTETVAFALGEKLVSGMVQNPVTL